LIRSTVKTATTTTSAASPRCITRGFNAAHGSRKVSQSLTLFSYNHNSG
jgi:hypothetical protein